MWHKFDSSFFKYIWQAVEHGEKCKKFFLESAAPPDSLDR